MRDQEFSSPGREFAPPKPEFTRPRAEFAPTGREHASQGSEFEQTSTPTARSKKRRISPLMLTAAAVTTAVVTVSGLGWGNDPKLLLSIEERAVMDAVTVALKSGDIDRLILLTEDPVICRLITETLPAFYDKEAHDHLNYQRESYNNSAGGIEQYTNVHFSYDGRYAGLFTHDELDYYHLDYGTFLPTGSDAPVNTTIRFSVDEQPDYHDESPYQSYDFYFYRDEEGNLSFWEYHDTMERDIFIGTGSEDTDHFQATTVEGTEYYLDNRSSVPKLTVKEGSCLTVEGDPGTWGGSEGNGDVFIYYDTYLENGTVSTYYENGNEWVLDNIVVVRDGYSYVDGVRNEDAYHEYLF